MFSKALTLSRTRTCLRRNAAESKPHSETISLRTAVRRYFFLNSPDITEVCILKLAALVIFLHHLRHCFQQAVSVILIQLPKASLCITPPSKCGRAAAHSPRAGQVSSRAHGSFCHLCPGLPAGNEQSRKASAQLALLLHVSLC